MSTTIERPATAIAVSERKDWRRMWRVGLLAIVGSAIVNLVGALVLGAVLSISSEFDDLSVAKVEPFTIAGAVGAVLVFALVYRFSSRPNLPYRIIATIVLLLSALPDVGLIGVMPGATVTAVSALFALHVTEYLVCVGLLTTQVTRE